MPIVRGSDLIYHLVPMVTQADPLAILLNYGGLGIFLVLLITGQVRTKSEVENYKAQLTQQQRIIDAFTMNITGQTLPALAKSTQVLEHLPRGEAAIISELQRVAALLQEMKSDGDSNSGQGKG